MAEMQDYVAVYDVTLDRERARVAKVLEGFGQRVQFSAFELRLTSAGHRSLLRRLRELNLKTGWVGLYRRSSRHERSAIGAVPPNPLAEDRHAWVITPADDPTARQLPLPTSP